MNLNLLLVECLVQEHAQSHAPISAKCHGQELGRAASHRAASPHSTCASGITGCLYPGWSNKEETTQSQVLSYEPKVLLSCHILRRMVPAAYGLSCLPDGSG